MAAALNTVAGVQPQLAKLLSGVEYAMAVLGADGCLEDEARCQAIDQVPQRRSGWALARHRPRPCQAAGYRRALWPGGVRTSW